MSNLQCVGNEARLVDCRRIKNSERNCNHARDVSIVCSQRTGQYYSIAALKL